MGRIAELTGSIDPVLTKLAIGYKSPNFIADLVAPSIPVLTETGTFFKNGKEGFLIYDAKRAYGAEARKIFTKRESDTYTCYEYALEHPLDYEEIKRAQRYGTNFDVINLEQNAQQTVSLAQAVAQEKAVADIILSGTYYASGNKVTLTGNDQWTSKSTSHPLSDIDTGIVAARADMGKEPNTAVFGYTAWNAFRHHPNVLAKIRNGKNNFVSIEDAKEILGISNIFIGRSIYATDPGVFTDLWGDDVALIYLPVKGENAQNVTVHTVRFNVKGYPIIRKYANKKTLDIEETQIWGVKNIDTSFGYLIDDVCA